MKNIFEFNRFIAFVEEEKLDEAISEETQKTEIFSYTSKGSKGTSASASTDERDKAFKSLKDFYSYAYEKGYPTAPGFDNENKMTLTEWMKTPGFEECEDLIEKAALGGGGKQTIEALVDFKKSKPEEYAMMVMWATHDKFPKGDFEDQDGKRAPLRRKGSKFLYSVMKEIAKPGENLVPVTKSGEPVPEDAAVYLPFDDKTDTSDFFERNSWSLSENFKKWLETNLISKCREQAKTLNPPKGQPKGYLAEIKATGSCSTIPNTVKDENGKELTFKELADKRANEAINYVKKELEKIGIVTDNNTKITLDTDGSNKGKKLTASLGHLPKGTDLTGTSGDIWDGKI